ncbi:MAG: tetratricopeptide repeat protein [Gemmatimonadaceae bacterium]
MRHILLPTIFIASLAPSPAPGQLSPRDRWADTARVAIEAAYRSGDIEQLRGARALVERALTAFAGDPLLQHYYGYAFYREANLLMGQRRDEKEYRPLLEQADSLLERSASKLALPETYALRSSVLGQLIGSSPLRGMTLGPRSSSAMDRAIELGSRNPRVWMLRGVGAMFTPAMFGGGVDRAEQYLRKAIALFADDRPAPPLPAWGHAEAYAWLGQVLHKQKRIDDARAAYAKALELQPDNGWVRHVLLPALDRAQR